MTASVTLPPRLRDDLAIARSLVVLTGAGMSAESGVPVFRGPGGLWEGFRPEDLATGGAFARDPARVWRWYRWRLTRVLEAEPHTGHLALARLETSGRLSAMSIVTQNVDGLHARAGSLSVLELHGNITRARCSAGCPEACPSEAVDPEQCACRCGRGRLRPDVVWFGETLDPGILSEAARRIETADMVWLIGTSSLVHPAASLPRLALERGVSVIEVNPEPTPLTDLVTGHLRAPAAQGIPLLVESLSGGARAEF